MMGAPLLTRIAIHNLGLHNTRANGGLVLGANSPTPPRLAIFLRYGPSSGAERWGRHSKCANWREWRICERHQPAPWPADKNGPRHTSGAANLWAGFLPARGFGGIGRKRGFDAPLSPRFQQLQHFPGGSGGWLDQEEAVPRDDLLALVDCEFAAAEL